MNKRLIFTGATAMCLVGAMALVEAQGRAGGFGGGLGPAQGRTGGRGGQMLGPGQGRMGGRGGQMPGGPIAELARVGLSADQREKVRAIVDANQEAGRDAMQAVGDAHRALNDAIYAVTPDAGAIASAQSKVAEAEAAQLANEVKVRQAIAEILTPEQKAKLVGKSQ